MALAQQTYGSNRCKPDSSHRISPLMILQARFQQKQLQEKEEKLLKLYEEQQKRALKSVGSRSGGSSVSSGSSVGVGKVRYLFQSRRISEGKNGVGITGRDKSYPLEPLTKYPSARNLERGDSQRPGRKSKGTSNWSSGPHQRSYSLDRYKANNPYGGNENWYDLNGNEDFGGYDDNEDDDDDNSPRGRWTTARRFAGRQKPDLVYFGRSHSDLEFFDGPRQPQDRTPFSKSRNANRDRRDDEQEDLHLKNRSNVVRQIKRDHRWVPDANGNEQSNGFLALGMEGRFRNFVSQTTANRNATGQQGQTVRARGPPLSGRQESIKDATAATNSIGGNVTSPVKKIRKPTPVPLSVAPTHLFQRDIKRTPRAETIKEVPTPVSSTRNSAPRLQGSSGSPGKPPTSSTGSRLPPASQRSSSANKFASPSPTTTTTAQAKSTLPSNLVDCRICGRHFAADRVLKHEEVCQKSTKKRKPFDALQQRVKGTEVEKYIRKSVKTMRSQPEQPIKPQNNWRKKHEEFIRNIRAAKEVSVHLKKGGKLSDLPPPPPSDYSDYIQCPHCSRKFNSAAADRHIPKCANIINNKPKPGLQKNGGLKQGARLLRPAAVTSPPAARGRK